MPNSVAGSGDTKTGRSFDESSMCDACAVAYVYEVKIRNTGEKRIRTLTWEYVFFEPGTELEVGRRRFVSRVNIPPGRTGNVVMRSTSPPTGTFDAAKAGKKSSDQYAEQVVIQSVVYADGSVWQAASN